MKPAHDASEGAGRGGPDLEHWAACGGGACRSARHAH